VPKLSSPQIEQSPASIKFPKNFQPVGTYNTKYCSVSDFNKTSGSCITKQQYGSTSKNLRPSAFATTSRAADVGMLLKIKSIYQLFKTIK
jgi:hypothetical protein